MPRLRRPLFSEQFSESYGRNRRAALSDGRHLGYRLFKPTALLCEHICHADHSRTCRCRLHGCQGGESQSHHLANLWRRRRTRHWRQPFHPCHAAQHRHQHRAAQQPYLRTDQRPVFTHVAPWIHLQVESLRHRGGSLPPGRALLWSPRPLLCARCCQRQCRDDKDPQGRLLSQGCRRL